MRCGLADFSRSVVMQCSNGMMMIFVKPVIKRLPQSLDLAFGPRYRDSLCRHPIALDLHAGRILMNRQHHER